VDLKGYGFVGVDIPEHSKKKLFFSKNAWFWPFWVPKMFVLPKRKHNFFVIEFTMAHFSSIILTIGRRI